MDNIPSILEVNLTVYLIINLSKLWHCMKIIKTLATSVFAFFIHTDMAKKCLLELSFLQYMACNCPNSTSVIMHKATKMTIRFKLNGFKI